MDCFLYDNGLSHERVNQIFLELFHFEIILVSKMKDSEKHNMEKFY